MPRRRTPSAVRPERANPADCLITWQEAAEKLGLRGRPPKDGQPSRGPDQATFEAYVKAYPQLKRAARYRYLPGHLPARLFLASAVAEFVAGLTDPAGYEQHRRSRTRRLSTADAPSTAPDREVASA